MKTFSLVLFAFFSLSLRALQLSADELNSKDIALVNTESSLTLVIFLEGNEVHLRTCQAPISLPLSRDCEANVADEIVLLENYINGLPYETGSYPRTVDGLKLVTAALDAAKKAVAGGNNSAKEVVTKLTSVLNNLQSILSFRSTLLGNTPGLTYYEYQSEYLTLISPFRGNLKGHANFEKAKKELHEAHKQAANQYSLYRTSGVLEELSVILNGGNLSNALVSKVIRPGAQQIVASMYSVSRILYLNFDPKPQAIAQQGDLQTAKNFMTSYKPQSFFEQNLKSLVLASIDKAIQTYEKYRNVSSASSDNWSKYIDEMEAASLHQIKTIRRLVEGN